MKTLKQVVQELLEVFMKPRSIEPITTEPTEKTYTQTEVHRLGIEAQTARDIEWLKKIEMSDKQQIAERQRMHWETIVEVLIDGHTPTTDAEYQALHASKVALFADKMLEEWDKRWNSKDAQTPSL